ncbi:MAG: hypothetical protein ACXW5J_26680 [Thermoanaerobaculia bacterium]
MEEVFYSKEEGNYQIFKQPGIRQVPAVPSGIYIPREASWNATRARNKIDNRRVRSSGFKSRFAHGNLTSKAGGTIIYNYDLLGFWLAALCDGLTSGAFSGVLRVEVTNPGSGYTSAPNVAIAGTTGAGATAVPVVVGGQIEAIIVTSPGANYTGPMTVTITGGGGGAGGAATAIINATMYGHAGTLQLGAPDYYLVQKGVTGTAFWRRYFDLVLRKVGFSDTTEGICQLTDEWIGTGQVTKVGAQLDGTPSEITGAPGSYGGLAVLRNGAAGLISELSTDIECDLKEKRGPMANDGKATALRRGGWMASGSGKAWFQDEQFDDDIEGDVLMTLLSVIASDDGAFYRSMPEMQCELGDWETSDEGIVYPFSYESIVDEGTVPINFTVINNTASY